MAQQANTPIQPGQVVKTTNFQPETLVFTFNHAAQAKEAQDQQMKGFEHACRYYHISTPIQQNSCVMYRFQLKGTLSNALLEVPLHFGSHRICIRMRKALGHYLVNVDMHNVGFTVSQYLNKNNKVCLKFGPINRYCNGFALYYSAHYSKVQQGLALNEYSVIATAEDGKF